MENVYLVECVIIVDCELVHNTKTAWKSWGDAMAAFLSDKKIVEGTFTDNDDYVRDETSDCFEVYEEGYYPETHGSVTLTELKVQ